MNLMNKFRLRIRAKYDKCSGTSRTISFSGFASPKTFPIVNNTKFQKGRLILLIFELK